MRWTAVSISEMTMITDLRRQMRTVSRRYDNALRYVPIAV